MIVKMAASMSKEEYLRRRYLSSSSSKKKLKKPKAIPKSKIVDDDIELKTLASRDSDDNELETGDDAPLIVGIVDERPTEIQKMEMFTKSSKWRVLGNNDNSSSPLLNRINTPKDCSNFVTKCTENALDKGSDQSPPRPSLGRQRHDSDADISPLRQRHDSDSDQSPERHTKHNVSTLVRSSKPEERHNSDSVAGHVRRKEWKESDQLHPRTRQDSDSDQSPPRARHDSDQSPPRTRPDSRSKPLQSKSESAQLPKSGSHSRIKQNSRHFRIDTAKRISSPTLSSDRKRNKSDSDHSPPRRMKSHVTDDFNSDRSLPREHRKNKQVSNSQHSSPERKSSHHSPEISPSDQSPKRRGKHRMQSNSTVVGRERNDSESDSSPPRKNRKNESSKLLDKTLDGRKAGLLDSKTLKLENEAARKREKSLLEKMGDELSGRNAKTVLRDRATGQRRNLEEERRQKIEEDAIKAEREAKYHEWGRGLKQKDMQISRLENDLHEMSKPLARYSDDVDLDKTLRDQERDGDPMLAFIKKKRLTQSGGKELPKYNGPQPPPNRYNIWPGYRWDGVDRSNGFEKTRFTRLSSKVAAEIEAYKWSTEDM